MRKTPKTIEITVTANDIAKGERFQSDRCPIARALARVAGRGRIYVNGTCVWIRDKRYALPSAASNWIYSFDAAFPVKPFAFQLKK